MATPRLTCYPFPDDVLAFSTTRFGGHSTGNYSELNINPYCGDDLSAVERNKETLCNVIGINADRLYLPHQVHGTVVKAIDNDFLKLSPYNQQQSLEGVDVLMTDVKDVCIGVSTADCIPVLMYDTEHRVVCAVHAGWRGTVSRVVQVALHEMKNRYATHPSHVYAQIAPGISLEHFEVGDEVYEAFREARFDMTVIAKRFAKWHIDLPMCNRLQLQEAGVDAAHIALSAVCTYANADTYFSARRLGTSSGRIYNGIMIR